MFKLLLISKYLRRKIVALFAASAVTLCTAMVIVVISVMGGFLDLLSTSAKKLTGDLIVTTGSVAGFPNYDLLTQRIESLDGVESVSPVIRTFGLIRWRDRTVPVRVEGIKPQSFNRVVPFRSTLHWPTSADGSDLVEAGMSLQVPANWRQDGSPIRSAHGGIVIGIEVNPRQMRNKHGEYSPEMAIVGDPVALTVVPMTRGGTLLDPSVRQLAVVNEFKSGLYDVDANLVYVDFDMLQAMLRMDPAQRVDPDTGMPTGEMSPAYTSELVISAAPGADLFDLRQKLQNEVNQLVVENEDMPAWIYVLTWQQRHSQLLNAVANEKGMVTFLFAIISIVAVVMVATTFYMIVLEKTKDIGILRAIGSSPWGILHIFLGYGLAIGVLGASVGVALAYAIVTNLNGIQFWLANRLGETTVVAGAVAAGLVLGLGIILVAWLAAGLKSRWLYGLCCVGLPVVAGLVGYGVLAARPELTAYLNENISWLMWDPRTYMFDSIPDQVKTSDAVIIALGAVISSVVGAAIPAIIAARLDPVAALRYE